MDESTREREEKQAILFRAELARIRRSGEVYRSGFLVCRVCFSKLAQADRQFCFRCGEDQNGSQT